MASVATRWRRYTRLNNKWHLLYSHRDDTDLLPWATDPELYGRIAAAFRELPLWLRVAVILRNARGRCWRDVAYEIWPDRTEWDEAHADPASGVWRLSSPCGYGNWKLYAPGVGVFSEDGFISNPPTALHPATGDAADPVAHGDPPMPLEQLGAWAVPWIEQVSDSRVIQFVEGWGAPYGPNRDMYEWVAFAQTIRVDSDERPEGQSAGAAES